MPTPLKLYYCILSYRRSTNMYEILKLYCFKNINIKTSNKLCFNSQVSELCHIFLDSYMNVIKHQTMVELLKYLLLNIKIFLGYTLKYLYHKMYKITGLIMIFTLFTYDQ